MKFFFCAMINSSPIKFAILSSVLVFALFLQVSAQTSPRYHVVQAGETLYRISVNNGVSVDDIRKWNNLSSSATIAVGQKLIVGYGSKESQPQQKSDETQNNPQSTNSGTQPKYYIVQPKETLYGVAIKHDVLMAEIRKWNKLTSDVLTPGQKLIVGYESAPEKQDNTALYQEYLSRGDEAFDEGNYDQAKKDYQLALTLKPGDAYAALKLEEADNKIREIAAVEESKQKVIEETPKEETPVVEPKEEEIEPVEAEPAVEEEEPYDPGTSYTAKSKPKGQTYIYFGAGVDFAGFSSTGLNYVIDRYNASRDSSFREGSMNSPKFLVGPSFILGAGLLRGKLPVELNWSMGFASTETGKVKTITELFSNPSDAVNTLTQNLYLRHTSLRAGVGYNFMYQSPLKLGVMVFGTFGSFEQLTKNANLTEVYQNGSSDEKEAVASAVQGGFAVALNIHFTGKKSPVGVMLRPYFQYNSKTDFSQLDEELNGSNTKDSNGKDTDLKSNIMTYGFQLQLVGQSWPGPRKGKSNKGKGR